MTHDDLIIMLVAGCVGAVLPRYAWVVIATWAGLKLFMGFTR